MIKYFLVVLLFMLLNFSVWFLVAKYWVKDDWVIVIGDNMKRFMKTMLAAIIIATLVCSVKLYKMGSCSTQGMITNAQTQYSWWMDQCQAKNAAGVYIDINRTRGNPGEENHNSEPY